MPINPNKQTLKRRSKELQEAARVCADDDAKALLLFYAAECVLKALYLAIFSLRTTQHDNALARPARELGHRLDNILVALKVRPSDCPTHPKHLSTRDGKTLQVGELHEAWRYGEKINNHAEVVIWLQQVIVYSEARL